MSGADLGHVALVADQRLEVVIEPGVDLVRVNRVQDVGVVEVAALVEAAGTGMNETSTLSRPFGGAHLMLPIAVGSSAGSMKMSLPRMMPACTDQAAFNLVVAMSPVCVKGS